MQNKMADQLLTCLQLTQEFDMFNSRRRSKCFILSNRHFFFRFPLAYLFCKFFTVVILLPNCSAGHFCFFLFLFFFQLKFFLLLLFYGFLGGVFRNGTFFPHV